jgi:S-adenosylmethionine:tRNA ribosyltransferase-isomerase
MKYTLNDFDYELDESLIAQRPIRPRDESKMLVCDKGVIKDFYFKDLLSFVTKDDLIIINNSKVIRSNMHVEKDGKNININFIKNIQDNVWNAFAKPAKNLSIGDEFEFETGIIKVVDKKEFGEIYFEYINNKQYNYSFMEFLEIYGEVPIPPYIRDGVADNLDEEQYQTVFAQSEGSVAAPTAGLHFSEEILFQAKQEGVKFANVTLHVGAGTFLPVKTDVIEEHKMHSEYSFVPQETVDLILETKKNNGRIFAVGTTSLRTLEGLFVKTNGELKELEWENDIFIYPPYDFKVVDCLITNFHLPKSTLIMLVSAFMGFDKTKEIYKHAVDNKYRFYSYGDASLLIR